jgi:hypothetical protein
LRRTRLKLGRGLKRPTRDGKAPDPTSRELPGRANRMPKTKNSHVPISGPQRLKPGRPVSTGGTPCGRAFEHIRGVTQSRTPTSRPRRGFAAASARQVAVGLVGRVSGTTSCRPEVLAADSPGSFRASRIVHGSERLHGVEDTALHPAGLSRTIHVVPSGRPTARGLRPAPGRRPRPKPRARCRCRSRTPKPCGR